MLYDGETFQHAGQDGKARTFRINIERDDAADPPWKRNDGHGVVSEWTTRNKRPGERVLTSDRHSKRFYDVQASIAIAKRDAWGAPPYGQGTAGQRAVRAVNADFEFLRSWCADLWEYVGVIVTHLPDDADDVPTDYTHALWGIESSSRDYIEETAHELASEASCELAKEDTERAHWNARDVATN